MYILHALLHDRVLPSLTDDQIGPLDNDDADEEGCVAGELHNLPLLVSLTGNRSETVYTRWLWPSFNFYLWSVCINVTDPLLSIAVLQIITVFIIPGHSDAQQGGGQEAIFSQDHKVGEETCQRLDHTWLDEDIKLRNLPPNQDRDTVQLFDLWLKWKSVFWAVSDWINKCS